MSIIQQLEDLKEWSQDSTRYERRLAFRNQSMPGGLGTEAGTIPIEFDELSDREIEYYRTGPWSTREDYSKGQLVQPGPGRQGYAKKTKLPQSTINRQEAMTWLTQAQVKAMKKNLPDGISLIPDYHIDGQWNYSFSLEKDRGTKKYKHKGKSLRATPENLEKLIEMREGAVKEMFPDRLTNREFKRLRFLPENISKTNEAFAEVIDDLGYKTRGGGGKQGPGKFTAFTVKDQQVRLGISNDVGNLAKVARKKSEVLKLIRESSGGKELLQIYNWDKYEKMLRNRASQIVKQDMIAKSTGRFPSGSTNEHKLWNSFYRATDQGDRIKIVGEFADGNLPRDADGYVDWYKKNKKDVPAWKRIEFVDTEAPKGKQKFKWGGLKGQVDNAFGSGFFTRNTKGYDLAALDSQRMFKGEKIGTLVRDKMLMKELKNNIFKSEGIRRQPTKLEIDEFMTRRKPGFTMSEGHHIEGVGKNPYTVEPAFHVANRKLGALTRSYKLGKIDKATFIKKMNELPGGIRYKVDDILEGVKSTEPARVKAAVKASGFNKNTANQIFKTYQKMGIGTKCQWKGKAEGGRIGFAAGGYDDCMNNAIKEHNKNLKSKDLTVRNEARAKQFNINKTKNMKSLMSLGARGGKNVLKLGRTWGIELEPIFEGGFYEYARRKGYTHEQAKEETFFWKMLDPSTKTGLLEGAEPLLEKELYEIKGEEEFMDVDNRPPMQDPEFGQVIGERKSVKRYVENEKALAAAYDKYNQLYTAYQVATTGRETDPEKAEQLMTASENLWEEIKGLEKQLNYDRDMYQAAVEKQQTEQGVRAIEYGEYGQGDTPELARRREEERYRLMNEKFPGYQKADMDQRLENWGVYIDPNLRSYKGRTVQRPEGLEYIGKPVLNPDAQRGWTYDDFSDYLKDQDKMAYFAENFRTEKAGGGIAGLSGGKRFGPPPESGPMPQGGGLSSQFNRVKKLTG